MQKPLCFFLFFITLTSFSTPSAPTILECNYNNFNFYTLNEVYSCEVKNDPNIYSELFVAVSSVSGSHLTSKSNPDVAGLYVYNKILQYFPQNLENLFANLKLIYINGCGLKEVHQEDLKPFADLTFLYLGNNAIEVIEQDIFAYNPNLNFIAFDSNKIAHIDSNVFDHLDKLTCFWFTDVSCVNQQASNSREKTTELINMAKLQCKSSDFVNLEEQIKGLENDAKALNFEDFKGKFEAFEKSFVKSKFSRFRPLKNKFEELMKIKNSGLVSAATEKSTIDSKISSNSCKIDENSALDSKFEGLESKINNFWNDTFDKFSNDLKTSQCGAKDALADLLTVKTSISSLNSQISTLTSFQESLKLFQTQTTTAINSIKSNLNNLIDTTKQSQDDIKTSHSDMEATFSDLKLFQNDVKSSLNRLKTTQNEIKISLNEVRTAKNGHSDDKLENLDNLQHQFGEFEARNAAQLEKIEKEVTTSRHKNAMNLDEKIKEVEKRIMKKIEEVLEEKLGKIIEDKLIRVIDSKFKKD